MGNLKTTEENKENERNYYSAMPINMVNGFEYFLSVLFFFIDRVVIMLHIIFYSGLLS